MYIPNIGFGTYKLDGLQATECCLYALEVGYRHIDTAQIYANEVDVGRALKQSGIPRSEIFLTTKIRLTNFTYQKAYDSTLASLRALQTEYVDLLLIHWPNSRLDQRPVLDAMLQLQKEQKVIHIGVSNYPIVLLQEAIYHTGNRIYTNQIEYHIYLGQNKIRNFCHEHGIIVSAYSPLAHGHVLQEPLLYTLAAKYNKTPAQIALKRLLQQNNTIPIVKSATPARIRENIQLGDFTLTPEDIQLLDALPKDRRYINPDFRPIRDD